MQKALMISLLSCAAGSLIAVNAWGVDTPATGSKEIPTAAAQEGVDIAAKVFEASDPEDAREKLSAAEREKFDKATMPAQLEVIEEKRVSLSDEDAKDDDEAAKAGRDCYGYNQTFKRKAALGNTLYLLAEHACLPAQRTHHLGQGDECRRGDLNAWLAHR